MLSLYSLYQLKRLTVNNWLMGIFHQVRFELTRVLFPPAGQEIGGEGFLHPYFAHIFFIAQHPVNGRSAPFRFACHRFYAMLLQIPLDFAHPVTLDVEIEDFTHNLGFLLHDLQDAI